MEEVTFNCEKNSPKILRYWSPIRDFFIFAITIFIVALVIGSKWTPINTTTIGVLFVLVFGTLCTYFIYQYFSNQPMIYVDETKIKTDFSIINSHEIYFHEVDDIIIYDYTVHKNFGIILVRSDKYDEPLSSDSLFLKKREIIHIRKHMVSIPMEDLYEILVQRWKGTVSLKGER